MSVDVTLAALERENLIALVEQFQALLDDAASPASVAADPALARLAPPAYRDDREAAAEFRRLTETDLFSRRRVDAQLVLHTLREKDGPATRHDDVTIVLDAEQADAWMRTLNALRLVLAERLGIHSEDDQVAGDARFGVYDWLGYRLDVLVRSRQR